MRRMGMALLLLVTVLTGVFGALTLAIPSAQAQEDEEFVIRGTLRVGRETIPDVSVSIADADGNEVGTGITDERGQFEISVPGRGEYAVEIDTTTLPDGTILAADTDNPAAVVISDTDPAKKSVAFSLESGDSAPIVAIDPLWQRLLNRAVSGIKVGLLVALASVGLSLIYGVTGLVNFAHSEMVTFGAVVAFAFETWLGGSVPFAFIVIMGFLAGGVLGLVLEGGLFRPLRKRKMSNISLMIVSIGLAFVMRYVIQIRFGTDPETYSAFRIQRGFDVGPISLPPKDYYIMIIAFILLLLVGVLLQRTKLGTAMRAVADNPPLAQSSGINVNSTILAVWISGSALASIGGIFLGLTQVVEWQMGEKMLLLIFAAVTLGGLGTAYGAMVGGLVIGFASEMSTFWLDNDLKFMVALLVLILVLLIRPQGILGVKERFG